MFSKERRTIKRRIDGKLSSEENQEKENKIFKG